MAYEITGQLARISHHLTAEARDKPVITSLHLLAVLNVRSSTPPLVERHAPRTDGLLTHFASPRGEKSGLARQAADGAAFASIGSMLIGSGGCLLGRAGNLDIEAARMRENQQVRKSFHVQHQAQDRGIGLVLPEADAMDKRV